MARTTTSASEAALGEAQAAVAVKAVEQGLAHVQTTYEEEYQRASAIIKNARDMTQLQMAEGLIETSD